MGADYEKALKSSLQFGDQSSLPANTTRYFGVGYNSAVEVRASQPIPVDGVLSHLFCHAGVAPGAGETYTYTVFINGNASILTCQTAGAVDTDSSDLVNAVAVVAGDLISIRSASSAGAAAIRQSASVQLRT